MAFARIANSIGGTLLVVAAFGFLIFLPENIADYAREPEDVWLGVSWIVGLSLLAVLCFVNAAHARKPGTAARRRLTAVNSAVLFGLLTLQAADLAYGDYYDPILTMLLALCVLGPTSAIVAGLKVTLATRR